MTAAAPDGERIKKCLGRMFMTAIASIDNRTVNFLCKQLNRNPRPESELRGWELLCTLIATCRPGNDFFNYVKAFMQRAN